MKSLVAAVVCLMALVSGAAARDCIQAGTEDDFQLSGKLSRQIFPGPPNFEDVASGDTPEPTFILSLDNPTCLSGDEFIEETRKVREIHLGIAGDDDDVRQDMRSLIGREVVVTARSAFGAHTGHHHAPIVAFATAVVEADSDDDFNEPGTPATTVRGFYLALEVGDGDTASQLVIPEKRNGGPFDAEALSEFYGNLRVPLELHSVRKLEDRLYEARYTFETKGGKFCDGLSVVTTTVRQGRNLIQKIKAPNGC